ncbi:MAG: DUF2961 domain-containing protein [Acidobacteria bacterium]|nr:DUF2961 domain-containing protein [Acidobacteriota bacterium]
MKVFRFFCLPVILLLTLFSMGIADIQREVITTGKLFREMIELESLTYFPDPVFKTIQFSSYDRRSKLPGGPDWFANSDGFGGEPIPNFEKVLREPDANKIGEYLIADVRGPGAIVRLWTAAISGTIRLYLDDVETPVYEGPAVDFFQSTYDGFPQMAVVEKERFGRTIYQRDASYAPIPFAASMRLVWIGDIDTIHFYQVGVRQYSSATVISTFQPEDIRTYRHTIDRTSTILDDPDHLLSIPPETFSEEKTEILASNGKKELFSLEGPRAIRNLSIQLTAVDRDAAHRQTVLHIRFDDFPWGQVQSPVGDFFGAAPGVNPYTSLPFTVQPDGTMICRFVLPFQTNCRISLENRGEQEVTARIGVAVQDYDWDMDRSMHFRARWRANHDLTASPVDVQDLPFLIASGKGVYVGTVSYLLNPNPVPTPYGSWWGEGDEKIFVDGEGVPSTFGTGSEDYYNYSWSVPDIFYFPYCGQPKNDGPGNRGFVTNFRWHILDSLPFQSDIRFYMELKSHEVTPGMSYARIGYHYARPGLTDDFMALTTEDVKKLELPEKWFPAARMGARNSVFYASENAISNRDRTTLQKNRLWAGGQSLVWMPAAPGETKSFLLEVEETGRYRIHFVAGLTPQSGSVRLLLDGTSVSLSGKEQVVNLYRPYRTLSRNFTLEETELTKGKHELRFVFEGANADIETPTIIIDFLWVQAVNR